MSESQREHENGDELEGRDPFLDDEPDPDEPWAKTSSGDADEA